MKGTIMLLNTKGQIVSVPSGFDKMNRKSQEFFLAPLREVLEPRSHNGTEMHNDAIRMFLDKFKGLMINN